MLRERIHTFQRTNQAHKHLKFNYLNLRVTGEITEASEIYRSVGDLSSVPIESCETLIEG